MSNSGKKSRNKEGALLLHLVLFMLIVWPCLSRASTPPNDDFPKTLFFKFLTEPDPTITKLIFRKELFLSEVPAAGRVQIFELKQSDGNYLLRVLSATNEDSVQMSAGLYKGRAWEQIAGNLTISDPALNTESTPISFQQTVTRMTQSLVLNLGITELVKSTLSWDKQNHQFVGKATDGSDLIINFECDNQLPKRAYLRNGSSGLEFAFIDYEYSSNINNGELPYRFVRHAGTHTMDLAKKFAVELFVLELSPHPMASSSLDPAVLFPSNSMAFYSNGVLYEHQRAGKTVRILTSSEYQKSLESSVVSRPKKIVARILVYAVAGIGLVFFGLQLLVKIKQKGKTE